MTQVDFSLTRIDQLRQEGQQAARDGLPFSANPYPYKSEHASQWERGYIAGMRPEEEAE